MLHILIASPSRLEFSLDPRPSSSGVALSSPLELELVLSSRVVVFVVVVVVVFVAVDFCTLSLLLSIVTWIGFAAG